MSKKSCPNCDYEGSALGTHFRWNPEHRIELSQRQKEIAIGSLMGDGTIPLHKQTESRNINTYLTVNNTNYEFLEWIYEEMKPISKTLTLSRESDKRDILGTEYNQKDYYTFTTISYPYFNELSSWYSSGEKRFPDMELTPLIAKVWYSCDGWISKNKFAKIGISNESDRPEFIKDLFRFEANFSRGELGMTAEVTEMFLDWIGEPLPGMEYKWGNYQ